MVFPTLRVFEDTHQVRPAQGGIRIVGQINTGSNERAFCTLAQAHARGEQVDVSRCPHADGGQCRLTEGVYPCLFDDPHSPDWRTVYRSVRLAAQR